MGAGTMNIIHKLVIGPRVMEIMNPIGVTSLLNEGITIANGQYS